MRVVARAFFRVGNTHKVEHLNRTLPGLIVAYIFTMAFDRLRYLKSHGIDGIERGHWVLEDHRDFAAAQLREFALVLLHNVLAVERYLATDNFTGWACYQSHH